MGEDTSFQASEDNAHRFVVSWMDQERTFDSRAEAVGHAKSVSHEHRVQVERGDGGESMQFFAGSLETFILETRDRRRRRDESA